MRTFATPQKRSFAKLIDLSIVLALGLAIPSGIGSIFGFFYSLVSDHLPFVQWKGQSVGKKIMKIKVISVGDGMDLKSSIIRNAPFGIITFFMIIPFWGWILALLISIPMTAIEVSLMVRAPGRQRLGDVMAETEVINA